MAANKDLERGISRRMQAFSDIRFIEQIAKMKHAALEAEVYTSGSSDPEHGEKGVLYWSAYRDALKDVSTYMGRELYTDEDKDV